MSVDLEQALVSYLAPLGFQHHVRVHARTRVGVVLVPRWKWISGQRQDRNSTETMKARAFADSFMDVGALVVIAYDWDEGADGSWRLSYAAEE